MLIDELKAAYKVQGIDTDAVELLPTPNMLRDAGKKVDGWLSRLTKGKEILIVADYDADGVLSAASAYRLLKFLGYSLKIHIPERVDGYGFRPDVIVDLYPEHTDILVLDSGTLHADTMMDVYGDLNTLIIDHHVPQNMKRTEYMNLINPHLDYDGPGNFCTASLLYMVGCHVMKGSPHYDVVTKNLLVYGGIATVTDVCDMRYHNRALVKETLDLMNARNYRSPIKNLLDMLKVGKVTEKTFGWKIGPMLNAPGRVMSPKEAMKFLLLNPTDPKVAENMDRHCEDLKLINEYRKALTVENLNNALTTDFSGSTVCVSYERDRPTGVNGLIAGGLCSKFDKPAFALAYNATKGLWEGSGRAPLGASAMDVLREVADTLHHFGGHEQACGLATEDPEAFKKAVENVVVKRREVAPPPTFKLELSDVTLDLARSVEALGPFGNCVPEPIFTLNYCVFRIAKTYDWGWVGTITNGDVSKPAICSSKTCDVRTLEGAFDFDVTLEVNKSTCQLSVVRVRS